MEKSFLVCLVASCLTLVGTMQAADALQVGAGIHKNRGQLTIVDNSTTNASLSIRMEVPWQVVETEKGVLKFPSDYNSVDDLAAAALHRHTPALLLLDYSNKFYGGGEAAGEEPTSAAAIQGFANYAEFMAKHYKGVISAFEVYNEWNLNITSTATPHIYGTASSYINLLKATYAAIKAANPNAIVVGGAVGGTDIRWVKQFIEEGGLKYLDVFSVHPYVYRHALRPSAPTDLKIAWIPTANAADVAPEPGTPEESIAWLDSIKILIDQASPNRSIPVYLTEVGWPTADGGFGVGESVQAAYVQRLMLMLQARKWIGGVWWYELIDSGSDPTNPEDRFGLVRQSGEPKPAFNALTQVDTFMQSTTDIVQETISNNGIMITAKKTGGGEVSAAWLSTNDFKSTRQSSEVQALLNSGYSPLAAPASAFIKAAPILLSQ